MSDRGPLDASDRAGRETTGRFEYQWAYAASRACELLRDDSTIEAVSCEKNGDLLLDLKGGGFGVVEIKTMLDQKRWSLGDKRIVATVRRFIQMDVERPNHYRRFELVSNVPFAAQSRSLPAILSALQSDTYGKSVVRFLSKFEDRVAAESVLRRLRWNDDLPRLDGVRDHVRQSLVAAMPRFRSATVAVHHDASDALIRAAQSASGPEAAREGLDAQSPDERITDGHDLSSPRIDLTVLLRVLKPFLRRIDEADLRASRLLRLHARSIEDLEVVPADSGAAGSVRLENVYVTRVVERELLAQVLDGAAEWRLHLVVGEAGFGKSSLLWHLTEGIQKGNRTPILLKASAFEHMPLDEFERDLAAMKQRAASPVLLIDTLDYLLGKSEYLRDRANECIGIASALGIPAVASCRPREARALRFNAESVSYKVERLTADEMHEALRKYVHALGIGKDPWERKTQISRLAAALDAGQPVRDVFSIPLTIRMLFNVYDDPAKIPEDISFAFLFKTFWDRRVVRDYRAGSERPMDETDLGPFLFKVALQQLNDLTLTTPKDRFHSGADLSALETAVSRGLLRDGGDGIEFFHQRFFEYAAGRAVLAEYGAEGIRQLTAWLDRNPADLFRSPVLANALLSSPMAGAQYDAQDILSGMLQGKNRNLVSIGMGVYGTAPGAFPNAAAAALACASDPEAAQQFIAALSSASLDDFEDIFRVLEAIWRSKEWLGRRKLLDELPRLIARDPDRVSDFLSRNQIVERLPREQVGHEGVTLLANALAWLTSADRTAAWDGLVALYLSCPTRSDDARVEILRLIGERAGLMGPRVATRLAIRLAKEGNTPDKRSADLNQAWGRLWWREWDAESFDLSRRLEALRDARETSYTRMLNGVRIVFEGGSRADGVMVWREFVEERNVARRTAWRAVVWQPLLLGKLGSSEAVAAAADEIAVLATTVPSAMHDGAVRRLCMSDVAGQARARFVEKFSTESSLRGSDRWLDERDLAAVTCSLLTTSLEGPELAYEVLIAKPSNYPRVAAMWESKLGKLAADEPTFLLPLAQLSIAARRCTGLLNVLESTTASSPPRIPLGRELRTLSASLLQSREWEERRDGARLWLRLVEADVTTPPTAGEIDSLLNRESHVGVLPTICRLVAMVHDPGDLRGPWLDRLISLASQQLEETKKHALDAAIALSTGSPLAEERADEILDVALGEPTDAGVVSKLGYLIADLSAERRNTATALVAGIVKNHSVQNFGNGARVLRARLRGPLREWARHATVDGLSSVLELVPTMRDELGAMIVEAVVAGASGKADVKLRGLMSVAQGRNVRQVLNAWRRMTAATGPESTDLVWTKFATSERAREENAADSGAR